MEESCSPTTNQNKNKTQKLNINGNKRPKQTSNQVDTTYSQKQEHVIGGAEKFNLSGSRHPLEGSQKVNKSAKEKQKAKEQARYLRKIHKNVEITDKVVEKHTTRQNTVDTLKEVNENPCKQSLKNDTSDLEPQHTNTLNANQSLLRADHNVKDKTKEQSKAQARDDDDESSAKKMHSDELHVPATHTNDEDSVVEEHYIFRLNKKSPRFPHAKFYCRLCNYHLDSLTLCKKHWKEPRHSKLEENKVHQWEIKKIKAPNKAHAGALSTLLQSIVDDIALNQGDIEMRQRIAQTVEKILHKAMPDVTVSVYGSSLSGFGFKDSDVNLSIEAPEGSVPSQVLVMACKALGPGDEILEDIEADFEGRFPCIRFSDKQSGLRCELSTGSVSALKTSQLLCDYCKIDPRVHLLAMALRYWARLCGVDSQSDGSMPAYSFVLMTIYFLQHCEPPVVPVLQENEVLEATNTDSLGELWIKMLKFYTFDIAIEEIVISVRKREPVSRDDMKIPNRRLAIEDPIAVNKKNIAKSLSSNIVFQYVFDRLQDALLYFGKPQEAPSKAATDPKTPSRVSQLQPHSEDIDAKDISYKTPSDALTSRSIKNTASDLLSNTIESGTGSGDMTQEHSVSSHGSCSTNSSTDAVVSDYIKCSASVSSTLDVNTSNDSEISKSIAGQNSESLVDAIDELSIDMCHANSCVVDDTLHVDASLEVAEYRTDIKQQQQQQFDLLNVNKPTRDSATNESDNNQDFHFVFDEKILTHGKKVMVVCNGCTKEGHRISECPDECLPNLVVLPAMDRHYLKRIDALCINIAETFCLKDWDMKRRDKAVENYEWFIQRNGYPDAKLQLFGSSRNGFGFSKSDMDICLKFQHHQTAEELDIPFIVEDLAKKLKRHNNLYNVIPISTAKVPIVKFVDRCMQLDADISLYNCLAQANTLMLHAYSTIDPRVRQLVYTVKVFAKVCDIGDASKGSLSSYAYTLMMLFFLQQRTPPVLPVLQELHHGKEKPKHVVEGCNAWYFSDIHKLPHVWRESNTESVGELWLGFLRFFTEDFNTKKHVVCSRQHKPLTRFEKMWTGAARGFAIEDPFDLDHNLGGGVSRKMATFIMQVFINAREHFGLPKKIGRFLDDFEFFLDAYLLTGGEAPPNDRCCRVCGKIGHFLKDCPHRKGKKDVNKGRDRDRDREDVKTRKDRDKTEVKPLEDAQQIDKRSNVPHSPIQDRVYTSRQSMQGANGKVKPALKPTGGGSKTAKIEPATPHSGTMQQTTTAKPPGGTMQQKTTAKPPGGTMQQAPTKTPGGTMQQAPAKTPGGTMQQVPVKTPGGTMQQAPVKTPGRTVQQAPAKPPGGTMQQAPAKTPGRTMQQAPTKPPGGTMQQAPAKTPGRTMQQTTGQVIHTQIQTKSDMPQQKNIEETWKQHKVDKKHNKKHDSRKGKRSENTNKTVINAIRTSVEQSAVEKSVNGTYDQAYPALPTMDQSQFVQPKQPGQQQPLQRSQELTDQKLQQYYTTNESQTVHLQTYLSSNNASAGALHSVDHLDQQQPLQRHKQQNDRFRSPPHTQLDSGPQHWSDVQQQHHHGMQQQQVHVPPQIQQQQVHVQQQQVSPQMQPQLNNIQVDQHTAEGFDISKFAKTLPFHNQPLPTNEKPLHLHELEAMQMQQHKQPHLQKQLNQHQTLQYNQGRYQQQQQKPFQPQNQQQKHFNQQQPHQEQQLQQHMIQQQHNLQQYQEQWNQPNQQRYQTHQQQPQRQQEYQAQHQQYQQEDDRIQCRQSLSSSPSLIPMTRHQSLNMLDTNCYQSVPDTFGAEGRLWNHGSRVLNSHKDNPSLCWPSDQQSYPNYPSTEESDIGSALLHGVSFLQSGTGQHDMQHMTSMHRMGGDTASSESTIPQHVNQHGSIQQ